MKDVLTKVADLLDALADETNIEVVPGRTKVAKVDPTAIKKVSDSFKDVIGETIPSDVAEKIAADTDITKALEKLAFSRRAPTALGEPDDLPGANEPEPITKEARLQAASDRFVRRITGLE